MFISQTHQIQKYIYVCICAESLLMVQLKIVNLYDGTKV